MTSNKEQITIDQEIEIVNEIFRHNLKLLRKFQCLSGEEMADKIGIHPKRINALEEGRMSPKFHEVIRIVDYFPITFDDLLDSKIELHIKSRHRSTK